MSPTSSAATSISLDGRRERGARNKEAVVSALLELYSQGEVQPPAARIAEMAGVSERSVFRYFDDMEDLASCAITVQWDRVRDLYETLDSSGDLTQRINSIIDHRLKLYDKVGNVMRVAVVAAYKSKVVALAVKERRLIMGRRALQQFENELKTARDVENKERILDYTLSLENIIYLKEALGLSHNKVRETLTVAIKSLFDS
jgi:AcrR family transcriptional regulator